MNIYFNFFKENLDKQRPFEQKEKIGTNLMEEQIIFKKTYGFIEEEKNKRSSNNENKERNEEK